MSLFLTGFISSSRTALLEEGLSDESTNLAEYISRRKERFSEEEIYSLLKQVALALDFAHSKNVIHRSLKLNNILIGKGPNGINIYISDFGLAKIIGEGTIAGSTFKGIVDALSPPYFSPREKHASLPKDQQFFLNTFIQNYAFLLLSKRGWSLQGYLQMFMHLEFFLIFF